MSTANKNLNRRRGNPMSRLANFRGLRGLFLSGAAALVAASGCTAEEEGDVASDVEARSTGLVAFQSCDDLLTYFQGEATADLELGYGYGYGQGVPRAAGAEPAFAEDAGSGANTGAPQASGDGEAGGGASGNFSTTNVQERGVDEADLVKTDGRFLYTVRGGHLLIVEADGVALRADVALDFNATQLLLKGDKLLVLGDAYEAPAGFQLPEHRKYGSRAVAVVYDVSNREAPVAVRTQYIDGYLVAARLTGSLARLVVHHDPNIPLPELNYGNEWEIYGSPDGSEPSSPPRIEGEGGSGMSGGAPEPAPAPAEEPVPAAPEDAPQEDPSEEPHADEIGGGPGDAGAANPNQQPEDPYAAWLVSAKARLSETNIDEWLPQIIERAADGTMSGRRASSCGDFYRPGERAGLGTTMVLSVDLDAPETTLPDPAVVSSATTVYASGEALYISTVNWRDFIGPAMAFDVGAANAGTSGGGGSTPGSSGSGSAGTSSGSTEPDTSTPVPDGMEESEQGLSSEEPDNREATQIHKLRLPAGGAAQYVASGRVHGQLLNQFSMSEFNGHLRVASTEHNNLGWGGVGRGGDVAVGRTATVDAVQPQATEDQPTEPAEAPAMERAEGAQEIEQPRSVTRVTVFNDALEAVGQTEDIAPNEEIFAVRFLDERGFVVTFEQTDPLFTIDLSTPTAPRVVGELKVLGFSTYLHPIGDDHLLGIGRAGDENGADLGLQLSLFDVSNFAAPALDSALTLGDGYTDAAYDHHAVTLYEGVLMLPLSAWTEEGGVDGLELFSVDEEGMARLGTIDHRSLTGQGGYAHVDRSLVIGDVIFSLSNVGLLANQRGSLEEVGRLVFPESVNGGGRDIGVLEGEKGETAESEPAPDADDGAM